MSVLDVNGAVIDSATTDSAGRYQVTVPSGQPLVFKVQARINLPERTVTVVDNTSVNWPVYETAVGVAPLSSAVELNVLIDSGWTGQTYGNPRSSAPFTILDTVYSAQQTVIDAMGGSFSFADLSIGWSVNNKPIGPMNYSYGQIITSHYNPSFEMVFLLGREDDDTEEFDAAVVAHEWFHYFEDKHSRSDSLGGYHSGDSLGNGTFSSNSILDPTVSFGEGFATAFGAIAQNSSEYIDTSGLQQGSAFFFDLEAEMVADSLNAVGDGSDLRLPARPYDGYWSELSIMQVIWDLYDQGTGDDDSLQIGSDEMIEVMVNNQPNTPYFTSIYTFLYHLRRHPDIDDMTDSAIIQLTLDENIQLGDAEYDGTSPTSPASAGDRSPATPYLLYNTLTADAAASVDMDGNALGTLQHYGTIQGRTLRNVLLNWSHFRFVAPASGSYTVKVWPDSASVVTRRIPGGSAFNGDQWTVSLAAGEVYVFAIAFGDTQAQASDFTIGIYTGVSAPVSPKFNVTQAK